MAPNEGNSVVETAAAEAAAPQASLSEAVSAVDEVLTTHGGGALAIVDGGGSAPEQVEIDKTLMSLVGRPINELSEEKRTIKGRVYSGEEIARAIPDVAAFLGAMMYRTQGEFFELNAAGQLVMMDGCSEAGELGQDFPTAKRRQTRVYYRDADGSTQVMDGRDCFTVKEVGGVKVLELSDAAYEIMGSIIMESGLPTLREEGDKHVGEYARMNKAGRFERVNDTWVDDDSLEYEHARVAYWGDSIGDGIYSVLSDPGVHDKKLGSRGVLRVNLNLEGEK